MKLSIITINFNNFPGLSKTLNSVASQSCKDFEHIIVDGGSTDGSVDFIKEYIKQTSHPIKWVSEKDKGIYNAMNKGIRMASGEYIQILNSGDCLAGDDVVESMIEGLKRFSNPDFLFGNLIKVWPDGKKYRCGGSEGSVDMTMLDFYSGTLDHDGAFIKRELYEKLGYYDENLRICSDWKWVMNAVVFNGVVPYHVNVDSILFDMTGVSENDGRQKKLIMAEREIVLKEMMIPAILKDYNSYNKDIQLMKRIHDHMFAYRLVWFLERCLFQIDKRKRNRKCYYR